MDDRADGGPRAIKSRLLRLMKTLNTTAVVSYEDFNSDSSLIFTHENVNFVYSSFIIELFCHFRTAKDFTFWMVGSSTWLRTRVN